MNDELHRTAVATRLDLAEEDPVQAGAGAGDFTDVDHDGRPERERQEREQCVRHRVRVGQDESVAPIQFADQQQRTGDAPQRRKNSGRREEPAPEGPVGTHDHRRTSSPRLGEHRPVDGGDDRDGEPIGQFAEQPEQRPVRAVHVR